MTDLDVVSRVVEKILKDHYWDSLEKDRGILEKHCEFLATLIATWLLECVPEGRPMDGEYQGFGDEYNNCKTCSHHLSECVCEGWNAFRAEMMRRLTKDIK